MSFTFKPDRFSVSKVIWNRTTHQTENTLQKVSRFIPEAKGRFSKKPQQVGALEINSKNFKIFTAKGIFILKKWPLRSNKFQIEKQMEFIEWLNSKNSKISKPLRFSNQKFCLEFENSKWSVCSFSKGNYFSGKNNQLKEAALEIGKLTNILKKTPKKFSVSSGPSYFSKNEFEIIQTMRQKKSQWGVFFGKKVSRELSKKWPTIVSLAKKISKARFYKGPIHPIHFDLHPHNLLIQKNKMSSFLDFDSCRRMPVGYGLAYSALKLIRQSLAVNKNKKPEECYRLFLENVAREYSEIQKFEKEFYQLSVSEVLRRIIIIFRLNLHQNQQWNAVLPILLNHLDECQILFKGNSFS